MSISREPLVYVKKPTAINPWIYTNLDVQSKLAHVMGTPSKLPKCILGKRIFPLKSYFSIYKSLIQPRHYNFRIFRSSTSVRNHTIGFSMKFWYILMYPTSQSEQVLLIYVKIDENHLIWPIFGLKFVILRLKMSTTYVKWIRMSRNW